MPRQYKLRLGDGTILAVDPQGMTTWLIDDKAMVHVGGSRGWRPLKEVLAQARAAAAQRVAGPAPAPPTPTAVLPLVPPPPPKAKAPVDAMPLIPFADEVSAWPAVVADPSPARLKPPVEAPPPAPPPPSSSPPPAPPATPAATPAATPPSTPPSIPTIEVDDGMPIIPFKPLDQDDADVGQLWATAVTEPSPLAESLAEVPTPPLPPPSPSAPPAPPAPPAPVQFEGDIPIIPFKPLDQDEDVLEELDLLIEDEEERPLPKEPLSLPPPPPLPKAPPATPVVGGWFSRLTRKKGGSGSLWGDEPPARWETSRPEPPPPLKPPPSPIKPAPPPLKSVAAPLKPPPTLSELPTLRFAPMDKEPVKAEELYRAPSAVGRWLKRVVLLTGLAGAAVVAVVTWPTWMPMLTELSVLLFSQGKERASQSAAAPGSAADPSAGAPPVSPEVQAAADRLPHLGPQTIQAVMATSEAGVLAAPEVFRRAYQAALRGRSSLDADEARELRMLEATVLAALRPAERDRVRAYGRLSAGQDLLTSEDEHVLSLFARGARQLAPAQRQRLQALLGKAVAAALPASPTAPRVP